MIQQRQLTSYGADVPDSAGLEPALSELGRSLRQRGSGLQYAKERIIEGLLALAALSSVLITVGIVGILIYEASTFFRHVSLGEFLTNRQWTPLFANPQYGILPLVCGTFVTTIVALAVAVPVGTISAIWLSEYCPPRLREIIKPTLELLAAVPTVVYGYFALLLVTPLLQRLIPGLPAFNMLSAGLVMGLMIIPYISSLSEDAMRAVPLHMREGSYAMGATKVQTAFRVIFPSAISGITAAYVLGVSRAVGETMVVAIAAGLTLFLLTLAFNIGGYWLRKRYRQAY